MAAAGAGAGPGATRPSSSHIPGLDGLRAVAVAAVLLFHAGFHWMPGGFLGVDVFFVLSGFLITSLLLREFERSGRISLRSFWARRVRRLFPALLVLLAAVSVYAGLAGADGRRPLSLDGLAALGYFANWRFVFSHQGYFARTGPPSLLQHTWSLSIEEQFYVVWPLVLALLLRRRRPRRAVLAVALTGAVASAVAMALLAPGGDHSRAYYGSDTHAQGLLIGAALAVVLARAPALSARARRAWGLVGGVSLAAMAKRRGSTTAASWSSGSSWPPPWRPSSCIPAAPPPAC